MEACAQKKKYLAKDYKSELKPIWCPGCGDYTVLNAITRALAEMALPPEEVAVVSGIGCSSRIPAYTSVYGFHGVHGRALPVATGLKLARPDLTVLVTGGDGDGFSIGGGHMPHLARKNVNVTYVLMDNHVYGLTKCQASPTSRREMKTVTTPYGGVEEPLDPVLYMLTYGASYVAQSYAANAKLTTRLIKEGMEHKGFAFINVLSHCPTFNESEDAKYYKALSQDVAPEHDVTDLDAAMHVVNMAKREERLPTGLLYKVERPTLDQRMAELVERVGGHRDYDLRKIIDLSRP